MVVGNEKLLLTIVAVLLLTAASLAVIFSARGEKQLGNIKLGFLSSLGIGVIHGSFFVPLQMSGLSIFVSFVPLTIGMVVTMFILILLKKVRIFYYPTSIFRMILAGLILGGGNYTALLTIQHLGVSQGYPLTQLGIIVNALWGIVVFKEVATFRAKMLITLSIMIALIGASILSIARLH